MHPRDSAGRYRICSQGPCQHVPSLTWDRPYRHLWALNGRTECRIWAAKFRLVLLVECEVTRHRQPAGSGTVQTNPSRRCLASRCAGSRTSSSTVGRLPVYLPRPQHPNHLQQIGHPDHRSRTDRQQSRSSTCRGSRRTPSTHGVVRPRRYRHHPSHQRRACHPGCRNERVVGGTQTAFVLYEFVHDVEPRLRRPIDD